MRPYQTSHPWLTFELDLRRLQAPVWLLLGEAQSKCEHLAGVPLRPDTAAKLHRLYLARGVLATTAIEGNTLTEREVERILAGELELPRSKHYLQQEIENIVEACNAVWGERADGAALTVKRICRFNEQVLQKLDVEEHVVPGQIRSYAVGVARYKAAPPADCAHLLERMCEWLEGPAFHTDGENRIATAILKAVLAHLYLAWIHPFGDGNGRTARLVEFHILIHAGVPTPAAHLLSNHYNETRSEYYRQLDRASQSGGDVLPFLAYAVRGFVDGLRKQIGEVRDQQLDVTWLNHVYAAYGDTTSPSDVRQRQLVLELGRVWPKALTPAEIEELSPRLARAYRDRTRKTLTRDLNAGIARELLVKEGSRFRARKEVVVAFLPERTSPIEVKA